MDEILASIRRIIESGDERTQGESAKSVPAATTSSPSAPAGATAEPDLQTEPSKTESGRFDVHYLPSARGEQGPETSDASWPVGPEAMPSVASDIPAGNAVPAPQSNAYLAESAETAPNADEFSAAPAAGNENSTYADVRPNVLPSVPTADFAFEFDDEQFEADLRSGGWEAQSEAAPDTATSHETASRLPEPANSQNRQLPESVIDGASALLSTEAGDQVASAFGDLARAIREGHMRSMEEMAREMMRPMLQEWLDDNLPRIVERLVREEIERVARGARY